MKSKFIILFCLAILSTPVFVVGFDPEEPTDVGAPTTLPPTSPAPSAPSSPSVTDYSTVISPASYSSPAVSTIDIPPPNTEVAPFMSLVGIPGIPDIEIPDLEFGDYINALYKLAISIAALFAVFKIVIAGVKYMLDDIVTHKQEAKADIRGALVGLLVILAAYIILNTINTDITKNQIAVNPPEDGFATSTYEEDLARGLAACPDYDASLGQRCVTVDMSQADCEKLAGNSSIYFYVHWLVVPGAQSTCTYVKTYSPGEPVDMVMTGSSTKDKLNCEVTEDYKYIPAGVGFCNQGFCSVGTPAHCDYIGNQTLSASENTQLQAKVCPNTANHVAGYTCRVEICKVAADACNAWCTNENQNTMKLNYSGYDSQFNACYTEIH